MQRNLIPPTTTPPRVVVVVEVEVVEVVAVP